MTQHYEIKTLGESIITVDRLQAEVDSVRCAVTVPNEVILHLAAEIKERIGTRGRQSENV